MKPWCLAAIATGALALMTEHAVAQTPPPAPARTAGFAYRYRILGVYDEQSGDPVEGVEVADVFNRNKALTTKTGTVSLFFLPDGGGVVSLRKIGYEGQTFTVAISPSDTNPITVVLKRAVALPAVVIKDSAPKYVPAILVGFEQRKKSGFGHFIDDSIFRKNDAHLLADLLPARMPGLQLALGARGKKYLVSGRKACSGPALLGKCNPTQQPSCYVSVYVDGVRIYDASMGEEIRPDFARMGAQDYAAAEFYQGAAIPAEFNSATNADCGVLLLWTRIK